MTARYTRKSPAEFALLRIHQALAVVACRLDLSGLKLPSLPEELFHLTELGVM